MDGMLGRTLGNYKIVEEVGRGGMAVIYKAYQENLDRFVAVKVLPLRYSRPDFIERFNREARAAARLSHPNILPIYDFGHEEGISYIVMKYVPTGTLKDRMSGPMEPQEAARFVGQIAAALDHAHERGVLHRDVKPSNALLDEGDWILLADFGLAKLADDAQLTASGTGVGTPAYMSPEQGQGTEVDARTDVYSLGAVLYEMVTGDVPFKADTPMAVALKHITEPLPPPRKFRPDLSPEVEKVIVKAMAKERAARYQSAGEMALALLQALEGEQRPPVKDVPPAPPEEKTDTVECPAFRAQLIITGGQPPKQQAFTLERETYIGRRKDNDIVLNDILVSGHHACISISGGEAILTDEGSRNGTYVNNKPVGGPFSLKDGDRIRVGQTELTFSLERSAADRDGEARVSPGRFCPTCKAILSASSLFCPECGRPLRGPESLP